MELDKIINEIEELMEHYRRAGLLGEVFGLKVALEIIRRVVGK